MKGAQSVYETFSYKNITCTVKLILFPKAETFTKLKEQKRKFSHTQNDEILEMLQ